MAWLRAIQIQLIWYGLGLYKSSLYVSLRSIQIQLDMVWLRDIQIQLIWFGLGLYKSSLIWFGLGLFKSSLYGMA